MALDVFPGFALPPELGRARRLNDGTSGHGVVIILDAFTRASNRSIVGIIRHLRDQYQWHEICVEGGSLYKTDDGTPTRDVSLAEYSVGPKEKRVEFAEKLFEEGKISGEEYVSFVDGPPLVLWGVDEGNLYDREMRAVAAVEAIPSEALSTVDEVVDFFKQRLTPLIAKMPGAMVAGDPQHHWPQGMHAVLVYLRDLQTKPIEYAIDYQPSEYPRLSELNELLADMLQIEAQGSLLVGDGIISANALLNNMRAQARISELDLAALFEEIDPLAGKVCDAVIKRHGSAEDAADYEILVAMFLLRKLYRLELTFQDYGRFIQYRRQGVYERACEYNAGMKAALDWCPMAIDFYDAARERAHALLDNARKRRGDIKKNVIVLIVGGFHCKVIEDVAIRGTGDAVLEIIPRFVVSDEDVAIYRRMLREKWETRIET